MPAPIRRTACRSASSPNTPGTRSSPAISSSSNAIGEKLARHAPQFTVIDVPSFQADPLRHGTNTGVFILLNFEQRLVLIGGTSYAGEIKKSIFTVMNYLLPQQNVMPMHCSANVGADGDVALFFGLSGTGKTTLSSDVARNLIGDDEHGWSDRGVFNIEGGCYAKMIRLSRRGRAADLRHHPPLRHRARERRRRSGDARARSRCRSLHGKHPRRLSAVVHRQLRAVGRRPAIRVTS